MNFSLSGLKDYAKEFVDELPKENKEGALLFGLEGDLGSGKTTFSQSVAKELGVVENVTSPTFVIAQVYETKHPVFKKFVHMDAYRLEDENKDTIGFGEYIKDPNSIVFVEWPAYIPSGFPKDAKIIKFKTIDEETRNIEYA